MSRLTQKDDQGNWCLKGVRWEQLHTGSVITWEVRKKLYAALWKLMEYEDTGFSPAQIHEMCDLYGEKCAELAEERQKNRWIPVDERLPEESLCSVIGFDAYRSRCCFVQYYSGAWHMGNESVKIIAWMPMLEPYRKEER